MSVVPTAFQRGGRIVCVWAALLTLLCLDGVVANRAAVRLNASGARLDDDVAVGKGWLQGAGGTWHSVKGAFHRLVDGATLQYSEKVSREVRDDRRSQPQEDVLSNVSKEAREQLQVAHGQVDRDVVPMSDSRSFMQAEPLEESQLLGTDDATDDSNITAQPSDSAVPSVDRGPEEAMDALRAAQRVEVIKAWRDEELMMDEELSRPALGFWEQTKDIITNVVEGTGGSVSRAHPMLRRTVLHRMRCQDRAVVLLLFCMYMGALAFTALVTYRQTSNNSTVTYYADPRYSQASMTGDSIDEFVSSFISPPEHVELQVAGFMPLPRMPDFVLDSMVEWMGAWYRVDFSFSLDLGPWLVPQPWGPAEHDAERQMDGFDVVCANPEDIRNLEKFLNEDRNDLAYVEVTKHVEWKGWDELATNIKSKIRQAGYTGIISVRHTKEEAMTVHKNKQWANFMHSRTTKCICVLSMFGWIFYQPYMWVKQKSQNVRCKFRVDCPIEQFWELISDSLGPQGFCGSGGQFPRRYV